MKKKKIDWAEYRILVEDLAFQIKKSGKEYRAIYAIPRGGLVVGVIISYLLNLEIVDIEKENKFNNNEILVVDDLIDTGKTLSKFFCLFDIAVIYRKSYCKFYPTFFVEETDDWIVFPYEYEEIEDTISKIKFVKGEIKDGRK